MVIPKVFSTFVLNISTVLTHSQINNNIIKMKTTIIAISLSFLSCFTHTFGNAASAQTMQEWQDSVTVINKLLDNNPKSLELRMRKAEAHVMLEQWGKAIDDYNSILVINPKHIGALYFRGFVLMQQRRYEQACSDYHAVLNLAPNHKGALQGLTLASLYDEHLQDAFDFANILIEHYPTDASAFSTRALVEERRGMNDLALEDLETAIRLETETLKERKATVQTNDDLCVYVRQRLSLQRKAGKGNATQTAIATLVANGMSRNMAAEVCK